MQCVRLSTDAKRDFFPHASLQTSPHTLCITEDDDKPGGSLFQQFGEDNGAITRRAATNVISHLNEDDRMFLGVNGLLNGLRRIGQIERQLSADMPQHLR